MFHHIVAARYCGSVREAAALPGRFLPELGRFDIVKAAFFLFRWVPRGENMRRDLAITKRADAGMALFCRERKATSAKKRGIDRNQPRQGFGETFFQDLEAGFALNPILIQIERAVDLDL